MEKSKIVTQQSALETPGEVEHSQFEATCLAWMNQIARDSIFEPFEGSIHLENVRQAMSYLDKKSSAVKRFFSTSKEKISTSKKNLVESEALQKLTSSKLSGMFKKEYGEVEKSSPLKGLYTKVEKAATEVADRIQKGYSDYGDKMKDISKTYILKAFETILHEDAEKWILHRGKQVLGRSRLESLEEVKGLSNEERDKLRHVLYPYDSPVMKQYAKTLDITINITLGTIVATNLPMSGVAVSLINMAKTIVKIGNRLNILCAIFGYQITSSTALLKISTIIIESMSDFENNREHTPLSPSILDSLFIKEEELNDNENLANLINVLFKKDAYIAIPGIGMVSLKKIQLDDYKIDLVIEHLVLNYFRLKELNKLYDPGAVNSNLETFREIYQAFDTADYFTIMREQHELDKENEKNWLDKLKKVVETDYVFLAFSQDLDTFAKRIYFQARSWLKARKT